MWILTSLGRPERIRAVAESYDWGSESPVVLTLWEGDKSLPRYLAQKWPWRVETVPMRGNGPTYNEMLRRYPNERCYGFLADDAILDEQGMLRQLEAAAGEWNVAYANDGHWGDKLPTMPCLGGDLVRAVGYLAPRNIIHWAIDNAWGEIGKRLGVLRYFEHLTYTHLNPIWGTADDDATYRQARLNSHGWEDYYRAWLINELPLAVQRVRAARIKVAA